MFSLRIVTPAGIYKEIDEVKLLNFVTPDGMRGLLSNHMPLAAVLTISKMTVVEDKKRTDYAIAEGFLSFQNNQALVIAQAVERKGDIDVARALAQKEAAEKRLLQKESEDYLRAQVSLQKALNRLKVAGEKE
ncbi:MAG: ATP synthase F1 subunit epsilon [Erysipelotrichaceae bacterium]|jgi:F-type H+-transporting ATPase subunit epsilon|nr:ATP synthase F1 subunit epsilon [Erysipelotrichaceae bacterium]